MKTVIRNFMYIHARSSPPLYNENVQQDQTVGKNFPKWCGLVILVNITSDQPFKNGI